LAWLAAIVVVSLVLLGQPLIAGVVTVLAAAALWWQGRRPAAPTSGAVLVAMVVALGVAPGADDPRTAAALLIAVALLLIQPRADRAVRPRVRAIGLGEARPPLARVSHPILVAGCLAVVMIALRASGLVGEPVTLAVVAVVAVAGALVAGAQLVRARRRVDATEVRAALARYAPRYAVYYSGPDEGAYQLELWLALLARSGAPGVLIVRELSFMPIAAAVSDVPVIYAESVEAIESVLVPGLTTVFYVNNEARNAEMVRYPALRHVHVGHGDSEKPSSYAAFTAIYDQIFVAGPAGAQRYADHGVRIPAEKFVMIGRPQLVGVLERAIEPGRPATVLYAPTWRGSISDMQLSSLDQGTAIVGALIAAGATVIFRPHPLSYRDATSRVLIRQIDEVLAHAGSSHLGSREADALTAFECMNRSTAMVADNSSLVPDYLFTDKPFALCLPSLTAPVAGTRLAEAAIPLVLGTDPSEAVARLLGSDELAGKRAAVRAYYLGDSALSTNLATFDAAVQAALAAKA
jgi:hypothetical protein